MKCDVDGVEMNRVYLLNDGNLLVQCILCKAIRVVVPDPKIPVPVLVAEPIKIGPVAEVIL